MAEEKKTGVTVVAISGVSRDGHNYENGTEAGLQDGGHLFVYGSDGKTIAIYAPGTWSNVVIDIP